jgi:hypothetical protein
MRKLTDSERDEVVAKTHGRCHICGDEVVRAAPSSVVFDHVIPRKLGGPDETWNLLLACRRCNGLRWDHRPETIQRILFLGVIANLSGYKKPSISDQGTLIRSMRAGRLLQNLKHRDHISKEDATTMLRRFNRFETHVVERMRKHSGTKLRWSDAVNEALKDPRVGNKDKAAYKRLVAYEKPGPEERKKLSDSDMNE